MKKSTKVVNFLDLCGHEKYLKTTIYGLMSNFINNYNIKGYSPDFGMIIVGSNNGVIGMTREHIMIT
jgi:GTPase